MIAENGYGVKVSRKHDGVGLEVRDFLNAEVGVSFR